MLKYSNKRCICAPKLIGRDRNRTKAVTLRADRTHPISPHYFHLFRLTQTNRLAGKRKSDVLEAQNRRR